MGCSLLSSLALLALSSFAQVHAAETKVYDFNVTWVTANPDGQFERPTIGINGQWPLPLINVTKGDRVVVNMMNQLGNESTSLHFHGLYQNGTTEMDGPIGVSQCAVPPGSTFTYNFTVNQPGTVGILCCFMSLARMCTLTKSYTVLVPFTRSRPVPGWPTGCIPCA